MRDFIRYVYSIYEQKHRPEKIMYSRLFYVVKYDGRDTQYQLNFRRTFV